MCRRPTNFYPRPPRGGRHKTGELALWDDEFLSTPSARRATLCRVYRGIRRDISIHALREEGDLGGVEEPSSSATISIHALREEGDERRLKTQILFTDFYPRPPRGGRRKNLDQWDGLLQFLSTPSARRATNVLGALYGANQFLSTPSARRATEEPRPVGRPVAISIHALREEGDKRTWGTLWC